MSWGIWVCRGLSLMDLRPQRLRETVGKKRKLRDWNRQRLGEADRQTNKRVDLCWLDSFEKQWRIRLGCAWVEAGQADQPEGTGCAASSGVIPRR